MIIMAMINPMESAVLDGKDCNCRGPIAKMSPLSENISFEANYNNKKN